MERRLLAIAIAAVLAISVIAVGLLLGGSSPGKSAPAGQPKIVIPPNTGSGGSAQASSPSSSSSTSGPSAGEPNVSASSPPAADAAAAGLLDGWKLTLPVNSDGGLTGKATELGAAAVTAPWLTPDGHGGLVFWSPSSGATTPNSGHSRTELVSLNGFAFGTGPHTLAASLTVTQAPIKDADIIVGQIHGNGAISSVPFVMLHWRDQSIVTVIKQSMSGSDSQTVTLLTGVPLNTPFSYSITDNGDGTLTLAASCDGRTQRVTERAPAVFSGGDVRFQAGDYQQAAVGASPTDGGRVTFHSLTAS